MLLRAFILPLLCSAVSGIELPSGVARFDVQIDNKVSGHSFPLHVFHPSPLPDRPMPLMVFVHGWLGTWSNYPFVWNTLVPSGVVIAMTSSLDNAVKAEPVNLGSDESLSLQTLVHLAETNASFPLYQRIAPAYVAAGHSEGGAASYIAGNQRNLDPHPWAVNFTSLFTLSGCYEGFDVLPYVKNDVAPAFVMTASLDCICPPSQHAEPYYKAMPSSCKFYASIVDGTHCNFAQFPNTADYEVCHIAEEALGCEIGRRLLAKQKQWELTTKYAALWLNYTLSDTTTNLEAIRAALKADSAAGDITFVDGCTSVN